MEDSISDDVEALYPGIRAVQIRLGEHKFTPYSRRHQRATPGTANTRTETAAYVARFIILPLFDRIPST